MWGGLIHTSSTHCNIAEIQWHSRRLTTGDGKCLGTKYQLMGHLSPNTTRRYLHLVLDDYVESMPASNQLAEAI